MTIYIPVDQLNLKQSCRHAKSSAGDFYVMSNKEIIQNTIKTSIQCINLFLLLLFFNMLLGFLNTLPVQSVIKSGDVLSMSKNIFITFGISIISIFVISFFKAGFYGIVLLKIKSQKVCTTKFFNLASKNFRVFLMIGLIIGFIIGFSFSQLNTLILGKIPILVSKKFHYVTLYGYLISFESFLTELFFVFAYPLVILGFFSESKLKPIRSSFSIVIKHIKAITFIILLLFLRVILSRYLISIIPFDYLLYQNILMPFITSPLSFLILIYSFLFLTENSYKELKFDFGRI